jgi:hypothetical protein
MLTTGDYLMRLRAPSIGVLRLAALLAVIAATLVAMGACGKSDATPTTGITDGPPSFPYIFAGKYTVAGKPGPAGQKIYARIGGARSPVANTLDGRYNNVIIGPAFAEDQNGDIAFYLGDPDGPSVKANETYKFNVISQPLNVDLDLNFASLP